MGEQTNLDKPIKHICAGLLAHVDAGKTTLAEAILYLTGSIRKLGRVDHQNAFLDNFELERERGITIFSKQAEWRLGDTSVTLMDTPGHVDFSAEMERTLQILDYAVLIISGADGVQGRVETLWKLLARYRIPVFLFVNKMDQQGTDQAGLMREIQNRLDGRCIDFGALARRQEAGLKEFYENLAMCSEEDLEYYLEHENIPDGRIAQMIKNREIFPCYFGSALKLWGVQELLDGIRDYAEAPQYGEEFGARVFKITRDEQGARLTHMKITGGTLRVKNVLTNRRPDSDGDELSGGRRLSGPAALRPQEQKIWEQKADQIRIFSGSGYQTVSEAYAGTVCAVAGLEYTYAGEGLGAETEAAVPLLEPVLSYRIELPPDCDVHKAYLMLRQLEEEEPELHIVWEERLGEIHAQLMGEVQTEVLKRIIRQRFGIWVEFGSGSIVYKETIAEPVEGMGHFEPLRHYAEVHLLLEPAERGSGLQIAADCSEDMLDRNWQRLILTHLEEKQHRGVLTGSEITDMKITLIAGRAHQKHTEGGDFRQATYRAVRHGLQCAKSVLLEPVYEFRIELPAESVGRAMSDIQRMQGKFSLPEIEGETAVICGSAPVASMRGYQTELISYTKGRGRMQCTLKGYEECRNAEEVIEARGYDPEADTDNPSGSVFCAHGAGYVVGWEQAAEYMHIQTGWKPEGEQIQTDGKTETGLSQAPYPRSAGASGGGTAADEKELEEIFERTYGTPLGGRKDGPAVRRVTSAAEGRRTAKRKEPEADEYLLVDGYNIIFAWDELRELAKTNIDAARDRLMDIMCNYQGYKNCKLILVFDAYKVSGGKGEVFRYHNIYIVYTKEAETADQYIEKTVREIHGKYRVTVATSDALEQIIIFGAGASRLSASGLLEEVELMQQDLRKNYLRKPSGGKQYLFDHLDDAMSGLMEDVRLGRRTLEEGEEAVQPSVQPSGRRPDG